MGKGKKAKSKQAKEKKKAKEAALAGLDEKLNAGLDLNIAEMLTHFNAIFQYARREYEKVGPGCVFWLARSHEEALSPDVSKRLPLEYRDRLKTKEFEYGPVAEHVAMYRPNTQFVILIAIRTGDARDSLMRSCVLSHPYIPNDKLPSLGYPALNYSFSDKLFSLPPDKKMCSNHACAKVETTAGDFKACSRCKAVAYCGADCQREHWRLAHKANCDANRADQAMRDAQKAYREGAPMEKLVADMMRDKGLAAEIGRMGIEASGDGESKGSGGGGGGGGAKTIHDGDDTPTGVRALEEDECEPELPDVERALKEVGLPDVNPFEAPAPTAGHSESKSEAKVEAK